MPRTLSISNKIFSFKGHMFIDDENGERRYDAQGSLALFSPTWTIEKSGEQLAMLKRKLWAWSSTWHVQSTLGDFVIKRKLFSWNRVYNVFGGAYDGAVVAGNIWDMEFAISHGDRTIASANEKLLSLRDRHIVQIQEDSDSDELFTTIVMVAMLQDKQDDSSGSGAD